jgi:predicted ester cyclase
VSEDNKALVRRFVDDWLGRGDADALREICHADVEYDWGALGRGRGVEELRGMEGSARDAFPDMVVRSRLMVAEGDTVLNYSDVSGTHRGTWFGVEATGRAARWTAAEIYTVTAGKIARQVLVEDWTSVLVQLGALDPSASHLPAKGA